MAATAPVTPATKVTFTCAKWPNLTMVFKASQQIAAIEDGKQIIHHTPPSTLQFKNGLYATSNADEIDFIRNHPNYTGFNPQNGGPAQQVIKEMPVADPNQVRLWQMLNQVGAAAIVDSVEKQYGIQPGVQVQDPVLATVQAQEAKAQNDHLYNQPGRAA